MELDVAGRWATPLFFINFDARYRGYKFGPKNEPISATCGNAKVLPNGLNEQRRSLQGVDIRLELTALFSGEKRRRTRKEQKWYLHFKMIFSFLIHKKCEQRAKDSIHFRRNVLR